MGALLFTIKTVILTALIIAVLQIRWDGSTLETKLSKAARETGVMSAADSVAQGTVQFVRNTWRGVTVDLDQKSDDLVDTAELGFNQSEAYMAKKSESARRAIEKIRKQVSEQTTAETE